MKESTITEENIKKLVDTFYSKVRKDTNLAPIFEQAIGEDIAIWQPHLHKMYDFWSSIMLSSGRYRGNPLRKHRDLPPFDKELFDRWLVLFSQTANELYTEDIASLFISKSENIARSLKLGIY
jgi:hemoglobin